jgi:hypothetical protein
VKALVDNQRGTSAVEMAIVSPLLVMFIFGIIEFGLLFYNKAMITNASREAARAGIVYGNPDYPGEQYLLEDQIIDVAKNYLTRSDGKWMTVSFESGSEPHPEVLNPPGGKCEDHGQELAVRVIYNYKFLLLPDFLTAFFTEGEPSGLPGSIDISTETRMRCE